MTYAKTIVVDIAYDDAVPRVKEAFMAQGFGTLTETDVRATLKQKLGEDMEPYVILGACNPQLAHRALDIEREIGLLLPCNVVVRADGERCVVQALDPLRSVAQLVELLSLLLLVGGIVFEMATGILNIQLFYEVLPFSFYTAHFYGAWVFMAAFVVHSGIRFGRMVGSLRSRSLAAELRTPTESTEAEPPDPDDLVSPNLRPPPCRDEAPSAWSERVPCRFWCSPWVTHWEDRSEGSPSCPREARRMGREQTTSRSTRRRSNAASGPMRRVHRGASDSSADRSPGCSAATS